MRNVSLLFCYLFVFVCVSFAFQFPDHDLITEEAVKGYTKCFGTNPFSSQVSAIQSANKKEDWNLWKKWVQGFAHFYNPYFQVKICKLGLCRKTADVRLCEIQEDALDRSSDSKLAAIAGAALHHVQDMSSPPHVVPVMHGLTDGFEGYKSKFGSAIVNCSDLNRQASSWLGMGGKASKTGLFTIFSDTAKQTLAQVISPVSGTGLTYTIGGSSVKADWELFWQGKNKDKNNFGSYGLFGNSYGTSSIKFPNGTASVRDDVYKAFKNNRIQHSIERSILALLWIAHSK